MVETQGKHAGDKAGPSTNGAVYDILRPLHQPLSAFFSLRTVAVIGASETPGTVGRTLLLAMKLSVREKEGIKIVDVHGRIVAGEEATTFRDSNLKDLIAGGATDVILNLRDVDYVDSTGLGSLVVCHTSFRKAGGRVYSLVPVNLKRLEDIYVEQVGGGGLGDGHVG